MERLGIDKPVAQVPGAPETAGEQFGEELLDLAGNTTFDEREHLARDPGECLLVECVALAVATQVDHQRAPGKLGAGVAEREQVVRAREQEPDTGALGEVLEDVELLASVRAASDDRKMAGLIHDDHLNLAQKALVGRHREDVVGLHAADPMERGGRRTRERRRGRPCERGRIESLEDPSPETEP